MKVTSIRADYSSGFRGLYCGHFVSHCTELELKDLRVLEREPLMFCKCV